VTLALSLDENDSDVHRVLAAINLSLNRDHDKALYHQERALALNPNDDLIVVQREVTARQTKVSNGSRRRCASTPIIPSASGAISAAPISSRGATPRRSRRFSISRPDHSHLAFLAACHAQIGDAAAAQGAAQEVLQRAPEFSIERFIATQHYKRESDREHHRAALLKAQLPA